MHFKFGGSTGFEFEVSIRLRFVFLKVGAREFFLCPREGLIGGKGAAAH
jgi:hypothetical protein